MPLQDAPRTSEGYNVLRIDVVSGSGTTGHLSAGTAIDLLT
ncbi:hypothetical protein ACFV2N_23350 [Streptomyces sp. NPDC059680]